MPSPLRVDRCCSSVGRSPSIAPLWIVRIVLAAVFAIASLRLLRRGSRRVCVSVAVAPCSKLAEVAPAIIGGYDRADVGHHQAGRRRAASRRQNHSAHRGRGIPDPCHEARHLSKREAEGFYAVHRERPFFAQPDGVHVVRAGDRAGARGAGRDQEVADADGRDRPGEGRRRARCARSSRSRSSATRRMDRMRRRRRRTKSGTSFAGIELV